MPQILISLLDWRTPEILAKKDSILAGIQDAIILLGDFAPIVNSIRLHSIPSEKPYAVAISIELSETGKVGTYSHEVSIATNNPHIDVRNTTKHRILSLLRCVLTERAEILEKSAAVLREAREKLNPPTCPECGHNLTTTGIFGKCPNCGESTVIT